jgi:hypothetical protein
MKQKEKSSHTLAIKGQAHEAIMAVNLKMHRFIIRKKIMAIMAEVMEADPVKMTMMIVSKEVGLTIEVLKEEKITPRVRANT